jgi:hypothetical protein
MTHTIAQTKIVLLIPFFLFIGYGYAQDIKKDTVYLDFSQYKEICKHSDLDPFLKIEKKEGLQFNLCGKAIFLHAAKDKPDTIDNIYLSNYPITQIDDIDQLINDWRKKTKPLLKKKYGEIFPNTNNKNNMFETYLIEKQNNNNFILYRVYWKNQEI